MNCISEYIGADVQLREPALSQKQARDRAYLMRLDSNQLIRNFELEAGRFDGAKTEGPAFGGWEDPSVQLRGHFLGHWLSAAAHLIAQTGDAEIKSKADALIDRLELCQIDNGGEWAAPIPEKYLTWIARGKYAWAPHYTIHKVFMGLIDMYRFTQNQKALAIAEKFARWFYRWTEGFSREEMDNILDFETGGMMECWIQLYTITKDGMYLELMERYTRGRLFDALLRGDDPLTNMHANTTIPEAISCAAAYELTGDEKWLDIVRAYWRCAVTDRGQFATGGQTLGEWWTPKMKLKHYVGKKNQESCTVYNMMRLADFLFRATGDPSYLQYKEYNLYNGIMAQTFWAGDGAPSTGLVTYFLPMKAGSRKGWGGETDCFWCCYGTGVQANASFNEGIFYQKDHDLYVGQYLDADLAGEMDGRSFRLSLSQDRMTGQLQSSSVNNAPQSLAALGANQAEKPSYRKYQVRFTEASDLGCTLCLRIPEWIMSDASVFVNGELLCQTGDSSRFVRIDRTWQAGDVVTVLLPIGVKFIPLPDAPDTGAFRYGPNVLVAIGEHERLIYADGDPAAELMPDNERHYTEFTNCFRTENQDPGFDFKPINEIGYEPYQMYFKIVNR